MSTTFKQLAYSIEYNTKRAIALLEKSNNKTDTSKFNYPNFVAIDFETANRSRSSACCLSAIVVENNVITDRKFWYINPNTDDFYFSYLHGIKASTVKNSPTIDKLWNEELKDLLKGKIVVAHNAPFDLSVLNASLREYDIEAPYYKVLDTVEISRTYFPHLPNHKLPTVCKLLNIDLKHHNAMSDAEACAKIVITLNNSNSFSTSNEKILLSFYRMESGKELFSHIKNRLDAASYSSYQDTYYNLALLQKCLWESDADLTEAHIAKVYRAMGDVYSKLNDVQGTILFYSIALAKNERCGIKRALDNLIAKNPDSYAQVLDMLDRDAFPEEYMIYAKPTKEMQTALKKSSKVGCLGCLLPGLLTLLLFMLMLI